MLRVKLFESQHLDALNSKMNEYLKENVKKEQLVSIETKREFINNPRDPHAIITGIIIYEI